MVRKQKAFRMVREFLIISDDPRLGTFLRVWHIKNQPGRRAASFWHEDEALARRICLGRLKVLRLMGVDCWMTVIDHKVREMLHD